MPIPKKNRRVRKRVVSFLSPGRTPSRLIMAPKKDENHPSPPVFPLYLPRKHPPFPLSPIFKIFFFKIAW
jgi:hypothetical protein